MSPNDIKGGNDVALVRLPRLAVTIEEDINQLVAPVCLPWKGDAVDTTQVLTMGWGRVENGPTSPNFYKTGVFKETLQKIEMPLLKTTACEEFFSRDLYPYYVCAGGKPGKKEPTLYQAHFENIFFRSGHL